MFSIASFSLKGTGCILQLAKNIGIFLQPGVLKWKITQVYSLTNFEYLIVSCNNIIKIKKQFRIT